MFLSEKINKCGVFPETIVEEVKLGPSFIVLCLKWKVNLCMQIIWKWSGNQQSQQMH